METVQVSPEKTEAVNNTVELLNKYDVIAAADLNKVSSSMLQDMRKQLRGRLDVKVVKNTIMRISMNQAGKTDSEGFMDAAAGPNVFLFTNGNPFRLAMDLEANKVKVFAKSGDIALKDIVISAGNTGLSPGPLIGKFGVLNVRTRIESGNIWVVNDVTVTKAGEPISDDLADLLQRMGIRAAEMGLSIKAVYERGELIPGQSLILDMDDYRARLAQAIGSAFQLAVQAAYVTPQTVTPILIKAAAEARAVAIEAGYASKETVEDLIAKANSQARTLASKVGHVMARKN
jgi:large subunit ribosomal protein L10